MEMESYSEQNASALIEDIKERLRMVNVEALKIDHFPSARYEELRELHELVMKREAFSPSEMQAIAAELGHLRG